MGGLSHSAGQTSHVRYLLRSTEDRHEATSQPPSLVFISSGWDPGPATYSTRALTWDETDSAAAEV
jgi:hypothetical protein